MFGPEKFTSPLFIQIIKNVLKILWAICV